MGSINVLPVEGEAALKNGQALLIRRPVPEDAAVMVAYLNEVGGESENLLFGKNEFRLTVEQEAEYIRNQAGDPSYCMLIGHAGSELVSIALISCPKRKRIAHNAEISISVRKSWWGRGVGTAMMERLLSFAKNSGTIRNISLGVKASNASAIALYGKMGFQIIGTHRNYFNIDGLYDDEHIMDLNLK